MVIMGKIRVPCHWSQSLTIFDFFFCTTIMGDDGIYKQGAFIPTMSLLLCLIHFYVNNDMRCIKKNDIMDHNGNVNKPSAYTTVIKTSWLLDIIDTVDSLCYGCCKLSKNDKDKTSECTTPKMSVQLMIHDATYSIMQRLKKKHWQDVKGWLRHVICHMFEDENRIPVYLTHSDLHYNTSHHIIYPYLFARWQFLFFQQTRSIIYLCFWRSLLVCKGWLIDLLGNFNTVGGTKSTLDITVDSELTSSEGGNHDNSKRMASINRWITFEMVINKAYLAPRPRKRPLAPSWPAIWTRREVTDWPSPPGALLILESKVSAGWEMIAAAVPAMIPAPRLTQVTVEGASWSLGVEMLS